MKRRRSEHVRLQRFGCPTRGDVPNYMQSSVALSRRQSLISSSKFRQTKITSGLNMHLQYWWFFAQVSACGFCLHSQAPFAQPGAFGCRAQQPFLIVQPAAARPLPPRVPP